MFQPNGSQGWRDSFHEGGSMKISSGSLFFQSYSREDLTATVEFGYLSFGKRE
jgi:hypothetical protein